MSCRLCEGSLFDAPVLTLAGMPSAAQYFPLPTAFPNDKGITLGIRQCGVCGLVQLDNDPVTYFREVITAATLSGPLRVSRKEKMTELVSRFNLEGKSALEVGSGRGEMLDILDEVGVRAVGIEGSAASVKKGRAQGRKMIEGYIGDDGVLDKAEYDMFICLNYLEHVPHPGRVLEIIHGTMKDDGIGYLTVPNLDYLIDTACLYEFVVDHLSYFTKSTLSRALELNGFDVLECGLINNENDVEILCKKRKQLSIGDAKKEVEILCEDLRSFVKRVIESGRKVAVWGAGHRTLALLALSGVKHIEYIIDSAQFKQGCFSPVTHFEIVAPDTLQHNAVDALLIMLPGAYSSEVIATVQRMNLEMEVAILRDNQLSTLKL